MRRIILGLVVVLILVADLELPGCRKLTGMGKPQPAEKYEKTAETKPGPETSDKEEIPPPELDSLRGEQGIE